MLINISFDNMICLKMNLIYDLGVRRNVVAARRRTAQGDGNRRGACWEPAQQE
jgi:hypothetical protein